jgi:excisionase family DNA binding protein
MTPHFDGRNQAAANERVNEMKKTNPKNSKRSSAPLNERFAFTIEEAVQYSGIGRTSIYALIKQKRLRSRRIAGRRLILRRDWEAFLAAGE